MEKNKKVITIRSMSAGNIWGKMSNWIELNKIVESREVRYMGNHITCDDNRVYAVFRSEGFNYFIEIE